MIYIVANSYHDHIITAETVKPGLAHKAEPTENNRVFLQKPVWEQMREAYWVSSSSQPPPSPPLLLFPLSSISHLRLGLVAQLPQQWGKYIVTDGRKHGAKYSPGPLCSYLSRSQGPEGLQKQL